MQATKVKGIINQEGKLIIEDPIDLTPGEVEVIVLQSNSIEPNNHHNHQPQKAFKTKIKAFEGLFDNTSPVSENFDSEQAKWEYLKEKHKL